jgi:fucose permease
MQHALNVSNDKALYALSFSVVGLTIARLLLGSLLKKISSFTVMLVSLLLVVAGSIVLYNSNSYSISFAALILMGMGLAGGFPVILGYVGQLYANLSGTAFSIALVIALTGNTIINYSFGLFAEKYSIGNLPLAICACAVCMIVLLHFTKQRINGRVNL